MLYSLDYFIKTGKRHTNNICEDYIICGKDPIPHIILSDGCSGAKNTDTGARLLAHIAKKYIITYSELIEKGEITYELLGKMIITKAKKIAQEFRNGLDSSCLNATLLLAVLFNNEVRVHMYGDGLILTINDDNHLEITQVEYSENAPYYLNYSIDPVENYKYEKKFKGEKIITYCKYDLKDFSLIRKEVNTKSKFAPVRGVFPLEVFPTVIIASDGLDSFVKKNTVVEASKIELIEVLKSFMSFSNNCTGEFIKRKFNRSVKIFERNFIFHLDDLAAGGFHFDREECENKEENTE